MSEKVRIGDLEGMLCGWKGCSKSFLLPSGGKAHRSIPKGWMCLIMTDEMFLKDTMPLEADVDVLLRANVDMVLCPEHTRQMYSNLKFK